MSGSEYSNRVPKGFVWCTCVNKGRLIGLITKHEVANALRRLLRIENYLLGKWSRGLELTKIENRLPEIDFVEFNNE